MKLASNEWTNTVLFLLSELSRRVRFIETERTVVVARGWRGGKTGKLYLIHTAFQIGMMKKFWRWILVMVSQQCKYS